MIWSDIIKLFDSYSRTARLAPALLTILPAFWTAVTLGPAQLDSPKASWFFSILVGFGLLYFLTSVARSRGKAAEEQLIGEWGGWPTTIALRHSDGQIDRLTKRRYHERLTSLCAGLDMPTPEEEAKQSGDADEIYRSATKRLIELRRDPKFELVHKETALYGFRRNLFGLKPIGILIVLVCGTMTAGDIWIGFPLRGLSLFEIKDDLTIRWALYAAFGADILALALWVFLVRAGFVRESANEYAIALLRTLEPELANT